MPQLTKKTIKRIRQMLAAIQAQPELYDQSTFVDETECGTVGCAAGWAVWLFDRKKYAEFERDNFLTSYCAWSDNASRVLGLPPGSKLHLFGTANCWPEPFRTANLYSPNVTKRAQACVDRWEHYIATDGRE